MLGTMIWIRMMVLRMRDVRSGIVVALASRASGEVGERGVEDGVLRTVGRKISATSNIPS